MKIVVTGGAGFIGRPLVQRLRQEGHEVVVADLKPPPGEGKPVDILDFEQLRGVIDGADAVFHLAGPVLDTTRKDPFGSSLVQFTGTLNVLEACRTTSVDKILVASSFYVYDGLPPEGIVNETSRLDPSAMELFGALKLMAEQLTLSYGTQYRFKHVILRFGSAYGLGEGSNLIQTFLHSAVQEGKLEVWGPGTRMNQYTYVEDIAEGCVLALQAEDKIFNLISPEETTTGELAHLLGARFGIKPEFRVDKPEGDSVPYMSSRTAMRALGWKPTPLPAALEYLVEKAISRAAASSASP
jgi:UDP-glucose 4-epimerase